ncbi:MAG: hypothetical protein J5I50_07630 [Chitinophagaceae bacterium]|nr:hypothetical protein [Chitinophagaceae bacterium]
MNQLITFFKGVYAYCTDFLINLANILGISYYEVNFFIFIILFPLLLIGSMFWYVRERSRLDRTRSMAGKRNP